MKCRLGTGPGRERDILRAAVALGVASLGMPSIAQGAWPEREIKLIVPFAPGGGTDLVSRLFAQHLDDRLGQPVFVENLAGGTGGSIGSLELARSPADGYIIGSGTSSGIVAAAYNPLRDLRATGRRRSCWW